MSKLKTKKQKLSECCKSPMIGGVQCENCGSNGKFTSNTAIVRKLEDILKAIKPVEKISVKSSEQAIVERFIDNGDGTISDTRSMPNGKRLMWMKEGSQERLTYAQAEDFVSELNKEQYPDWRLPTREELLTLVDDTKYNPAINPIFKCEPAGYWTSTPYADNPSNDAWIVDFNDGNVNYDGRYFEYCVRPVRQY